MKPEQALRKKIVKSLSAIHAVPVENPVWAGTPDVSHSLGWLELKVDSVARDNILPLKLLTPQQIVWLKKQWKAGGGCGLLIFEKKTRKVIVIRGRDVDKVKGQHIDYIREISAYFADYPTDFELVELVDRLADEARAAKVVV